QHVNDVLRLTQFLLVANGPAHLIIQTHAVHHHVSVRSEPRCSHLGRLPHALEVTVPGHVHAIIGAIEHEEDSVVSHGFLSLHWLRDVKHFAVEERGGCVVGIVAFELAHEMTWLDLHEIRVILVW
ncbi:hypothetical protein L917_13513, partial [Phytophthora nicotianae]